MGNLPIKTPIGIANDTQWIHDIRKSLESKGVSPNIEISIVIPYYRRPHTLKQTLLSLSRCCYDLSKIEVLIVDDGSPYQEIPNLEFSNLEIVYLRQKDKGYRLSKARNLGIRTSKFENIIILDCDLAVNEDFILEHSWPLFISKNVVSVGLRDSRKCVNEDIQKFSKLDPSKIGELLSEDWRISTWLGKPDFESSNFCWWICSGGNVAFHKSIFEDKGSFDERFVFWGGEDLDWAYRLYKRGRYFFINRDAKAFHFESKASEHQVSRVDYKDEKEQLLRELVPIYRNSERLEGEVPYVSVFMTYFRKGDHILDALKSIEKATSFRFEVVLLDDGSEDDLLDILDDLEENLRRKIKVIQKKHEGVEKAYIDCVKECSGEFVAQLDSDDLLLEGSIDTLVSKLINSVCDVAYGKYQKFYGSDIQKLEDGWTFPLCIREKSIFESMYTHPLRVFRIRAFYRSSPFENLGINSAVDFKFYSKLLMTSYGLFVNQNTYLYRQHENSISKRYSKSQIANLDIVSNHNFENYNPLQALKLNDTDLNYDIVKGCELTTSAEELESLIFVKAKKRNKHYEFFLSKEDFFELPHRGFLVVEHKSAIELLNFRIKKPS